MHNPRTLGGETRRRNVFDSFCRSLLGGSLSAYVICTNFINRFLPQSRDKDSIHDVRMASHKPFQFSHCDLTQILLSHQNEHMYTPPAFCTLVLCAKSCWGFYLLASHRTYLTSIPASLRARKVPLYVELLKNLCKYTSFFAGKCC